MVVSTLTGEPAWHHGVVTTPISDRPYGGASAEERRSARRRRVSTAVLDLVHERGISALTVGIVCERAAVSKRHFYETFDNLDDAAGSTLSDVLEDMATRIGVVSIDTGRGSDLIEVTVRAVLSAFDDKRLARLYLEAPGNDGLRSARDRAVARFVDGFLSTLAVGAVDDPRARLVAHLLVAGSTEVVAMWLRGDVSLSGDDVVSTLVELGTDALVRIRASGRPD